MERNNKWLVLANPNRCRHTDCLHKKGFVSWVQKTYPFEIGDIVYLYINGAVRFKTCVETAVDHREDNDYWVGKAPEHHIAGKQDARTGRVWERHPVGT